MLAPRSNSAAVATGAIAALVLLLVLALLSFFSDGTPRDAASTTPPPARDDEAPAAAAPRPAPPPPAALTAAVASAPVETELPPPPALELDAAATVDEPPDPNAPTIAGRVVDRDGAPIAGAVVYGFPEASVYTGEGWATAMTAADGRFALAPVREDVAYRLSAQRSGGGGVAAIATGARAGDRDVELVLGSGATIAGVVRERTTGRPVAGALVAASVVTALLADDEESDGDADAESAAEEAAYGFGQQPVAAQTDAAGAFTLAGLAAGRYEVRVRSAEHAPVTTDPITVAEGDRRDGLVIEVDAGVWLAGHVVDGDGRPVAGASVVAVSIASSANPMEAMTAEMMLAVEEDFGTGFAAAAAADWGEPEAGSDDGDDDGEADGEPTAVAGNAMFGDAWGPARRRATSGADGAFLLEHLAPGLVTVRASDREHAPARARLTLPDAGGLDGVELRLAAGGRIVGRIVGRDGAPAAAGTATVTAMPGGMMAMSSGGMRYGQVGEEGRYEIAGLAAGQYQVMAQSSVAYGAAPAAAEGEGAGAEGEGAADEADPGTGGAAAWPRMKVHTAVVRAGEDVTVDFDFGGGVRIEGTARRSTGEPVTTPFTLMRPESMWGDPVALVPDARGAFSAENVAPGRYRALLDSGGGAGTDVVVGDGPVERLEVVFAAGEVVLRIVDATTRAPIARIGVFLLPSGLEPATLSMAELIEAASGWGQSDAAGNVTVTASAGESLTVYAQGRGYVPATRGPISVASGASVSLGDIALAPGARARVRVLDDEGQPVPGAMAQAAGDAMPDYEQIWAQVSGADGVIAIAGLADGRHEIVVSADGFAPGTVAVTVPAPSETPVDVVVFAGGSLEVTVVDAAGTPVSGASVSLEPLTASAPRTGGITDPFFGAPPTTDARGLFHRAALASGSWRIRVAHADAGSGLGDVVIEPGEVARAGVMLHR